MNPKKRKEKTRPSNHTISTPQSKRQGPDRIACSSCMAGAASVAGILSALITRYRFLDSLTGRKEKEKGRGRVSLKRAKRHSSPGGRARPSPLESRVIFAHHGNPGIEKRKREKRSWREKEMTRVNQGGGGGNFHVTARTRVRKKRGR